MRTAIELACWPLDAEAAASVANSASCYDQIEDVGVLAVVETEGKLIEIQRQIILADVMVCANHATLEQRPERFDVVGMDVPRTYSWAL
jgi:hypothetical protein